MITISIKLTLLVLVLPVLSIVMVFVVGFYFYRESFDASALSTSVSSLLSAVLVILLVWERLRDSLSKKLEYLHKNFLFRLFLNVRVRRDSLFHSQDEVKRLRIDLEKYGKFMNFSLYPRGLMSQIDSFLSLHAEFYKRLKEIEGLAEKQDEKATQHRDLIWDYVGLKPDYRSTSYTADAEERYKRITQNITKEHPQLVEEAKDLLEKTIRLEKSLFEKLEDFLKSNNLRLEEEPSRW